MIIFGTSQDIFDFNKLAYVEFFHSYVLQGSFCFISYNIKPNLERGRYPAYFPWVVWPKNLVTFVFVPILRKMLMRWDCMGSIDFGHVTDEIDE